MAKRRNKPNLSYFHACLLNFLKEYHPQMAVNKNFVDSRAKAAENMFYNLVHEGKDHYTAHSLTLEELYTGLEFSLFYLIYDNVRENRRVPAHRRRSYSLVLLPLCNNLLDNYPDTDFNEDEFSLRLLEEEIVAVINKELKKNGF